jgi:hypothetical protein
MFSTLRFALAAGLGAATALLASCGSGQNLLPSDAAASLKKDFGDVGSAVASGDCAAAQDALGRASNDLNNLPAGVDQRLRDALARGLANLQRQVPHQCRAVTTPTQTTQTTPTTATQTQPTTSTTTTTPTETTSSTETTTTSSPPTTTTATDNGGGTPAPGGAGGGGNDGGQ